MASQIGNRFFERQSMKYVMVELIYAAGSVYAGYKEEEKTDMVREFLFCWCC